MNRMSALKDWTGLGRKSEKYPPVRRPRPLALRVPFRVGRRGKATCEEDFFRNRIVHRL
jgi:hypothetical protein